MYYVQYVDFCSPKLKEFKTKSEAKAWIKEFNDKMPNKDDFWIDAFYKGKIDQVFQADEVWEDNFFRVKK